MFWIYQGFEHARITHGSEYAWLITEYAWICQIRLSLKRGFGGCGDGFVGCDGLGGLGGFGGFDGLGGLGGFDGFSGFGRSDGFSRLDG